MKHLLTHNKICVLNFRILNIQTTNALRLHKNGIIPIFVFS